MKRQNNKFSSGNGKPLTLTLTLFHKGRGDGKAFWITLVLLSGAFFVTQALFATQALAVIDRDIASLEKEHGAPISLELFDVDIKNVLQAFAKLTGLNVIPTEGVSGTTSVKLKNVNPIQALESILLSKGFNWYLSEKNTIVVTPQKNGIARTFQLRYVNASQIKDTLVGIVDPELAAISLNEELNALVVKADLENLRKISKTIGELDLFPEQVVLEAHIIEMQVKDDEELGVQWKGIASMFGKLTNVNTLGLAETSPAGKAGLILSPLMIGDGEYNFEAIINALKKNEDITILGNPKVMVMNHREANILVGQRIGFKTTLTTQTGTAENIRFLETGTQLKVTPHINEEGFIRLVVAPKVSSGKVTAGDPAKDASAGLPQETTTETTTEVVVADGQTLVIGGMIRADSTSTEKGVPFLKDIPLLGILFRNREVVEDKREVMVFITPRLFTPAMAQEMKIEADKFSAARLEHLSGKHHLRPF